MASNLGKFELTFIFLRVRCHHYEFFAKTRSKQDHGCELFPAEFCGVTLSRYAHEGANGSFRTGLPNVRASESCGSCEPGREPCESPF